MYEEIRGELSEQWLGLLWCPGFDWILTLSVCCVGVYWAEVILSADVSNMTGCIVLMCTSGFDQPLR